MLPLQAWLDRFETRKKGDPNPFVVGKAGYQKFVDVLYACSEITSHAGNQRKQSFGPFEVFGPFEPFGSFSIS
jgi:hypothetical protein